MAAWAIPGVAVFAMTLFFAKLVAYTFLYWLPYYISTTEVGGRTLTPSVSVVGGRVGGGCVGDKQVVLGGWLAVRCGRQIVQAAAGACSWGNAQSVLLHALLHRSIAVRLVCRIVCAVCFCCWSCPCLTRAACSRLDTFQLCLISCCPPALPSPVPAPAWPACAVTAGGRQPVHPV